MLGAILLTRDGFAVLNRCPRLPAPETFAAMGATLLAAAEAALAELGTVEPAHIVFEAGKTRIVVRGVSDQLVLATISEPGADLDKVLPRVDDTAALVGKIVAG